MDFQACFVLHTRPYRETSLLVDLFSRDYGIVPAVAQGIRNRKGSRRAILQPFQRLKCRWRGKGELVTLIQFESEHLAYDFSRDVLYSGFYLNELLLRLLHRHDPHDILFDVYEKVLDDIQNPDCLEMRLREFELLMLEELGYGIDFASDINEQPIINDCHYQLTAQQRFMQLQDDEQDVGYSFSGTELMAIAQQDWQKNGILKQAKRLTRQSLSPLLGDKPLQSRALFRSYQHE